ncbi:MAG: hypothetical protein COA78_18740 [Blastopirellula sp.]|nr:MAG: hypothetical protein COA78_18740 [Blastopirellula sp.]
MAEAMNEYQFTGIDQNTGEPISDRMRATSEQEVRASAAKHGIDVETVELVQSGSPGPSPSLLLEFGHFISLIGCLSPLFYIISSIQPLSHFSFWAFIGSILAAFYSAAMAVVFSRVNRMLV